MAKNEFLQMDFSDFFGFGADEVQTKKEAKEAAKKPAPVSVENEDDELDGVEEEGTESAAPKASEKKKSSALTGMSKVSLPVTVFGRNFKMTLTEGVSNINDVAKAVYEAGYKEISLYSQGICYDKKSNAIYLSSLKSSDEDTLVNVGNAVVVVDGMLQGEFNEDSFASLDADEISVASLLEKFAEINPQYATCGINYDSKYQVATPVILGETVREVKLPATVILAGEETGLTVESFGGLKTTVSDKEIVELLLQGCSATIYLKQFGDRYVVEFGSSKEAKLVTQMDFASFVVNKEAKSRKAVKKYSLPLNVYLATMGITIEFTTEMFGGKGKVSEEEAVEKLKEAYSFLANKDRTLDIVYCKENNTLSVALTSGKKGSAYALPEKECFGIFKMIRTKDEFENAKKSSNFLGHYYDTEQKRNFRIEATPVATYVGTYGKDADMCRVQSVQYVRKVPPIPKELLMTILADFSLNPEVERIVQVYWDENQKKHILAFPESEKASKVDISYRFASRPRSQKLVVTIHSHNTMDAYFSATDNADEKGLTGCFGVIGRVGTANPQIKLRVGMEGAFTEIPVSVLFNVL